MMLCICTVLLVLVVNLNREVENINTMLMTLQESDNAMELEYEELEGVSDINGSSVDQAEAVHIVEAAAIENKIVWDENGDRSSGIKRVYLTFDDGPSSNTDRILDILDEYGVKATFFVVGKNNYSEQYRRIVADGHTLAMHSYSHVYQDIYSSLDAYKQDLNKLQTFLYEVTGSNAILCVFREAAATRLARLICIH